MSIHKRPSGRWELKWRDGERQRSRTFDRKGDAETFERELRRRTQLGPLLARELISPITLDAFVRSGFRSEAALKSSATRAHYAWALEHHLAELQDEPLVALDVPRLALHQQFLLDNGRSANTVREAWKVLGAILQVAVEHGHVPGNAVRALRKVEADPSDEVRPLEPVELEALIASFTGRERAVVLLAGHLGLRPLELRLAPWYGLTDDGLVVGRARTKKTAQRTRVVVLPTVTARELKRWRLESGRPSDDTPIIGHWTAGDLTKWGQRKLRPAVERITGRTDVTLYTLRHSHASALHYAGFTLPEAAERLGHGPELHVKTYAHVIKRITGRRWPDLDALIAAARAELGRPEESRASI